MSPEQLSESILDAILSEVHYVTDNDRLHLHYAEYTSSIEAVATPKKRNKTTKVSYVTSLSAVLARLMALFPQ